MTKQYNFFEDFDEILRFRVNHNLGKVGLQSSLLSPTLNPEIGSQV
jgi:hypothetical protein